MRQGGFIINSNTTKIIAVVVVVIVIVAVACVLLVGDDDEDGDTNDTQSASENLSALDDLLAEMLEEDADYPCRLLILGNANMDSVIDDSDLEYVEELIANGYNYVDDYFADANYDGLINEEDLDIIELMISFEQDVVYYFNVDYEIVSFNMSYPLNLGNILTQTLEMECILCADNIVATDERCAYGSSMGTFYTEFEYILDYDNLYNLGSHKSPNAETFAEIAKACDGYFTVWMNSASTYNTQYLETQLASYDGIQIVRLPSWELGATASGLLTAGYLFNGATGTAWDNAVEYVEWYDSIMNEIYDRVATIDDDDKKKVILADISSSTTDYTLYVGNEGMYNNTIKLGVIDVAGQYADDNAAVAQTWSISLDKESLAAFYQQYGVDVIVCTLAAPYSATADDMIAGYDNRIEDVSQLDGVELLVTGWINGSGPGEVIYCLMLAQYLYPDLFSDMSLEDVTNTFLSYVGIYGTEYTGQWSYDTLNLLYCGEDSPYNIMAD